MVGQNVGKYRVIERIGRGGMGTVYRAHDETLDRDVAIKVLNPEISDPEVVRRFRAEAVTVAKLNDPGIATIYELLQHEDQWLMVMEFVRGETLERLVDRAGALAPERAAELCTQVLTALGHAHRMGVVHRDLKPANLMMTETGAMKIMDFGIARVAGSDHLTHAGHMMGTPAYMAPEQVLGQEVDARADLYSMGVVLYRLMSGKLPFKGDTAFAMAQSQVNDPPTPVRLARDTVPAWVDAVTARALAKSPADRFQNAEEFCQALRRGVSGRPLDATVTATVPTSVSTTAETMAVQGMLAPDAQTITGPTGAGPTGGTATLAAAGPATVTLKKRNLAAIGAGAIVILAVIAGIAVRMSRSGGPSTSAPPAAVAAPATPPSTVSATPAETTPASTQAADAPLPAPAAPAPPTAPKDTTSAGAASSTAAPASTPATPPAAKVNAPRTTKPGDATAAAPPPRPRDVSTAPASVPTTAAPADPHIAFVDVKLLDVKGTKADDQDVVLSLAAGQISVVSKKGGDALRSLSYAQLMRVTYAHAKDPQWDASFSSPPPKLDVPGVFKSSRHWLTLQTRTDYLILRLSDANFATILQTVESRTGIPVDKRAK